MGEDREINTILNSLARSNFRGKFALNEQEKEYVREKGLEKIREHANDFISKRLAPEKVKNDGRQTPMRGHPVFIAQHATATCCRGCLYKWHKIKQNKALTINEQKYVVDVIMGWIMKQIRK